MQERTSPFTNVITFPDLFKTQEQVYTEETVAMLNGAAHIYRRRLAYAAHFGITPETASASQRAYYGI